MKLFVHMCMHACVCECTGTRVCVLEMKGLKHCNNADIFLVQGKSKDNGIFFLASGQNETKLLAGNEDPLSSGIAKCFSTAACHVSRDGFHLGPSL